MGLPLFIPPVEADVTSKPTAKGTVDVSYTRSPIRRTERRRHLNETREQRLRVLAASQSGEYSSLHQARSALQPQSSTRSLSRPGDAHRMPRRQSPRLENPRVSELVRHLSLERHYGISRVAAGESSQDLGADNADIGTSQPVYNHVLPYVRITTRSTSPPFDLRPASFNSSGISRRSPWAHGYDRDAELSRYHRRRRIDYLHDPVSLNPTAVHRHAQRVRYADGLGDRDRSLSPEGDGEWDTLQSTLTPDPQPPSVGSSFTSTIASTTPPETTGTDSINTSMTTPNEELDPPCDPIVTNPGSDEDDDIDDQWLEIVRRQPIRRARRSYADVVAEPPLRQTPDSTDASDPEREYWSDMHRIIRRLASREDIPEEWWLQAGLSRSMTWDDSI
jgi:hypothetical protein